MVVDKLVPMIEDILKEETPLDKNRLKRVYQMNIKEEMKHIC